MGRVFPAPGMLIEIGVSSNWQSIRYPRLFLFWFNRREHFFNLSQRWMPLEWFFSDPWAPVGRPWQTQALRNVNLMQKVKPQTNALLDEMATLLQVMAGCWVWGPGLLNPNAACVPAGFWFYIDDGRCFPNNESLGNVINFGPRENACLQQRGKTTVDSYFQAFQSLPAKSCKVAKSTWRLCLSAWCGVSLDFAWRSHTQGMQC